MKGFVTTVHSYTNDQVILDYPHKDLRRARAAALNIIPTTTGAAKAVSLVIPELKGKFDGFALRVPDPHRVDNRLRGRDREERHSAGRERRAHRSQRGRLVDILDFTEEPLVSMDFKGDPHSSIVDGLSTMVIGDNLVKVIAWYDNEWGYACRVADLTNYMAEKGA